MQVTRVRYWLGGIILAIISIVARAETLQPDPAWQQGKLNNGFSWQVLTTPQRPSDRVQIRLVINTGSLAESPQQLGFSHLLPRIALLESTRLDSAQLRTLWQQGIDPDRPHPPAITSYDYTLYSYSLANNRPETIKEAFNWLAGTAGDIKISVETASLALHTTDPVASWPANPGDAWWRYRLKGSTLSGHDPRAAISGAVDIEKLKAFYHQWYTPDAMTLYVVGNVDGRAVSEQISKVFSSLEGKREMPLPLPVLPALGKEPVVLSNDGLAQGRLSLVWDSAWQPLRDARALQHYWKSDLVREALFTYLQKKFSENKIQNVQLGFDCRVFYQRAQCAINLDAEPSAFSNHLKLIAQEMESLRDNGVSQTFFDELIARKTAELSKLFATYARMDTEVLMNQRLRSQQNAVVDIAPEQYQKLRQHFLAELTRNKLNQELQQQLTQVLTLVLLQADDGKGVSVAPLQTIWQSVMAPVESPAPTVEETKPEAVEISPVQKGA
ncbi:MAG: Protein YhjJ [Candidatus Erwinia impunctatus]|nr:Protein YhjJ [Culicoides impunctatus]